MKDKFIPVDCIYLRVLRQYAKLFILYISGNYAIIIYKYAQNVSPVTKAQEVVMVVKTEQNRKTVFTRMCIGEAVASMLTDTPLDKLKVSDVAKKAGVARMTFYKYYSCPKAALTDYLDILVSEYMEENSENQNRFLYMDYEHILYSLKFFDRYADFFMKLYHNNLYGILIEGVDAFMEAHIQTQRQLSKYMLYSYAGGLLNSFLKWEEGGKAEPVEDVAKTIFWLYNPSRVME